MDHKILKRWLTGFEPDNQEFCSYLQNFPEALVECTMYKGLSFNSKPSGDWLEEKTLSSWTNNLDVAEYFASNGRFGIVISTTQTGYSIPKILESIIKKENANLPDFIRYYSFKRESEIVAPIRPKQCKIRFCKA